MVKRSRSFYEKKRNYYKNLNFARKEKFILWMFWKKETLILWISGSKRRSFSTHEDLSLVFTRFAWYFKNQDRWSFSSQKTARYIFFSMEYHVYWLRKSYCFELSGHEKYGLFWVSKLMERWYLLISGKFWFWIFWRWKIRSFFEPKSWWKNDIYWLLESPCFDLFGDG